MHATLFSATLRDRDPEAPVRWLASLVAVGLLLGMLAVVQLVWFVVVPNPGQSGVRSTVAGSLVELADGADPTFEEAAREARLMRIAAPEPPAPPPVVVSATQEAVIADKADPDALITEVVVGLVVDEAPVVDPREPAVDVAPEAAADSDDGVADLAAEDSSEEAEDAETVLGAEDGAEDGAEHGAEEGISSRTPSRASGMSRELMPGEMATCLVRRDGKAWHVQGCATGLHQDAADLAADVRRANLVLVTLRGS